MRLVRCLAVLLVVALDGPAGIAAERTRSTAFAPTTAFADASLFGAREVFSPDNSAFFKWTGMLARFADEQRRAAQGCKPGAGDPSPSAQGCPPAQWQALVAALDGLDPRTKLERVNTAINRYPYVSSPRNWGESNYWETPFEFLRKGGQCQDYAVAKYLLLRAAGMPADELRVVVVRDARLALDHAVTVAYVGGQALMLDNQLHDVVPAASVHHYQPD